MTTVAEWSKQDRIQWIEERERRYELETDPDRPTPQDLRIWLSREKDKESWGTIARDFGSKRQSRSASLSAVRRAHGRVVRYMNPSLKKRREKVIDAMIQRLFLCTPEQFRAYILKASNRSRRPDKAGREKERKR